MSGRHHDERRRRGMADAPEPEPPDHLGVHPGGERHGRGNRRKHQADVLPLAEYVENYLGKRAESGELNALIEAAVAYNRDFVAPTLHKRAPVAKEAEALRALDAYLASVPEGTSAEDLQTQVYEIGKNEAYGFESLRDWFRALYETLLGSSQGPRMGSFIALYGVTNTRRLIAEALAR